MNWGKQEMFQSCHTKAPAAFWRLNLLPVPVFVRWLCRETERAGQERLIEKQQRRRKSGQPAAQEEQRDGENAVRTHLGKNRPSARQTEMPVFCLRPVRGSEIELLPLFSSVPMLYFFPVSFTSLFLFVSPCPIPQPRPPLSGCILQLFSSPCIFFAGWWCPIKATLR